MADLWNDSPEWRAETRKPRVHALAAVLAFVESPLLDMVESAEPEAWRHPLPDGRAAGEVVRAWAAELAAEARGRSVGFAQGGGFPRALAGVTAAIAALSNAVVRSRAESWLRGKTFEKTQEARAAMARVLAALGVKDPAAVEHATWRDAFGAARREITRLDAAAARGVK